MTFPWEAPRLEANRPWPWMCPKKRPHRGCASMSRCNRVVLCGTAKLHDTIAARPSGHYVHRQLHLQCCNGAARLADRSCCDPNLINRVSKLHFRDAVHPNTMRVADNEGQTWSSKQTSFTFNLRLGDKRPAVPCAKLGQIS